MGDETLSQDEIDALLKGLEGGGAPAPTPPAAAAPTPAPAAAPAPRAGASDKVSRALASCSESASGLLSRPLSLAQPAVSTCSGAELAGKIQYPSVAVYCDFTGGGGIAMALSGNLAGAAMEIMQGGSGANPPAEYNDIALSAASELLNTAIGGFLTGLGSSQTLGSPSVVVLNTAEDVGQMGLVSAPSLSVLAASANLEGVGAGKFLAAMTEPLAQAAAAPRQAPAPRAAAYAPQSRGVAKEVSKVEFGAFEDTQVAEEPSNLNLLLDVPMQVTVELGRTKMTVQDVLSLASGSIVELDKLAGEPVDFLVNGKLIAKGEVVVIDENFGIRITDIVTPRERFAGLMI